MPKSFISSLKHGDAKSTVKLDREMKPLKLWLPLDGSGREIVLDAGYVERIIVPSAEHEAGHIIAARHYGARVLGIALGFIPEVEQRGMFLQALYKSEKWATETQCIVKAAGSAADIIHFGQFNEQEARQDLRDIEQLSGKSSWEPYLTSAQEVLRGYECQFKCITRLLRESLEADGYKVLGRLPGGRIGCLLLDEDRLMACLGSA